MSTSYPYLSVARIFGVPYRSVLCLSDQFDKSGVNMSQYLAMYCGDHWVQATYGAWHLEQERRRKSSGQEQ